MEYVPHVCNTHAAGCIMYVYIGMLHASADMLPGYKSLGTLEVSRAGRDGAGSGSGEREGKWSFFSASGSSLRHRSDFHTRITRLHFSPQAAVPVK